MFNVVKPGYCTLLQSFNGRYRLPSRKYYSETAIPSLYSNERAKLLDYTIHYINANWKLQSKCLQTHYLPGDHTSEILTNSLTTMDLWKLKSENQVYITTDSGSNIVKATRDLKWCPGFHILGISNI